MFTRDLAGDEWVPFFNAFSRRYRGQCVTIHRSGPAGEPLQAVARRMPLEGITAERVADGRVATIQIILGDTADVHLMHVIGDPTRVRVAQVTDGADELLLVDTAGGVTTRIDFSPMGLRAEQLLTEHIPTGVAEVL